MNFLGATLLSFLLFYSSSSFALCEYADLSQIDDDVMAVFEKLNHLSASDEEVQNAFCKTKEAPSLNVMAKKIQEKKNNIKEDELINGVKLEDESTHLLDAFRELTTSLHNLGYGLLPDAQVDFQERFHINPECTKVECAVKKIWGEEMGTKILYIYLQYGFNSSEFSYSHSTQFAPEELDDVLIALEDFPSHYQNQNLGFTDEAGISKIKQENYRNERPKAQRLSRFNFDTGESQVLAEASIRFYNAWTEVSRPLRQYTTFHELSHTIAIKHLNRIDYSVDWLNVSGWTSQEDKWIFGSEACFVSSYAKEKPSEDFAESVTAYRYAPERFKERCPQKYAYIKKHVFNDKEYSLSTKCESI